MKEEQKKQVLENLKQIGGVETPNGIELRFPEIKIGFEIPWQAAENNLQEIFSDAEAFVLNTLVGYQTHRLFRSLPQSEQADGWKPSTESSLKIELDAKAAIEAAKTRKPVG